MHSLYEYQLTADLGGDKVKKIINDANDTVIEGLGGFVECYSRYYDRHPEVKGVIAKNRRRDKVALVVGGGSGHEPMFAGFVGKGLADAAACGNIFASPDPNTVYETANAVNEGKGILFVYGNYAGDNLNFDVAEEFLNDDGIPTAHVRVWDDVASAPIERIEDRRGIAGDVFVIKIAGAVCDSGLPLEKVVEITEKARDNTKSIGIAVSPGQIPGLEKTTFELGEDEIEYGMGIHGEQGIQRTKMQSADILTEKLYKNLMNDARLEQGDEICVIINGLGSTTNIELAIVYRKIKRLLDKDGISVYDSDMNNFCTSQGMGGFSVTFMKLDDELKMFYDKPCYSPYYAKGEVVAVKENMAVRKTDVHKTNKSHSGREIMSGMRVKKHDGVLKVLNAEQVKDMLIYIADKVIAKKSYLTEIDSAIGDGDHGIGMEGGMQKVKDSLLKLDELTNVYSVFETAGKAMLMSMGGASGVIFGSLYLAGAKEMEAKEELNGIDLAVMERKSLEAIKERGKAEIGDKTMVDALEPAVLAMEANKDKTLLEMLKAAEDAARQGVENSKEYVAKFGRAKSLMERAIGHQDAGATSVWLIVQGMREYVEGDIFN